MTIHLFLGAIFIQECGVINILSKRKVKVTKNRMEISTLHLNRYNKYGDSTRTPVSSGFEATSMNF